MTFTVDPVELHNKARKLSSLSDEYTTVYNRLLTSARTMGDAWNASDNLAFVEQINGFCEELKAMADHLKQSSLAMDTQAKNYETARDNNATTVRTLAN